MGWIRRGDGGEVLDVKWCERVKSEVCAPALLNLLSCMTCKTRCSGVPSSGAECDGDFTITIAVDIGRSFVYMLRSFLLTLDVFFALQNCSDHPHPKIPQDLQTF
jgi:hypothetical protein